MYIEATYKSKQQIGIYVHMDVIFKSGSICNFYIDQMIHIYEDRYGPNSNFA